MVDICVFVYFKILGNLSYNKVVLSHISRNTQISHLAWNPFFMKYWNLSGGKCASQRFGKPLNNIFFYTVFYWTHLSFLKRKEKVGTLSFL